MDKGYISHDKNENGFIKKLKKAWKNQDARYKAKKQKKLEIQNKKSTTYIPQNQKKQNTQQTPRISIQEQYQITPELSVEITATETPKKKIDKNYIPTCPHCNIKLEVLPTRKKKCQNCNNYMYIRKNMTLYDRPILKYEEAEATDAMGHLRAVMDIPNEKYFQKLNIISDPLNTIIEIANELEEDLITNRKEYLQRLQTMYFSRLEIIQIVLAEIKNSLEIDPTFHHKMREKYQLASIQLGNKLYNNRREVIIETFHCCEQCRENQNIKIDVIEESKNPRLPNPNCTRKSKKRDKFFWCTCRYSQAIEWV